MMNQTYLRQSLAVRRPQTMVARAAVIRWLLITSVALLLNAPDNIIRLLILVGLLCEDCAIRWNPFESPLAYSSNRFNLKLPATMSKGKKTIFVSNHSILQK